MYSWIFLYLNYPIFEDAVELIHDKHNIIFSGIYIFYYLSKSDRKWNGHILGFPE